MNKTEFDNMFRAEILPELIKDKERPDLPLISYEYSAKIDELVKSGVIDNDHLKHKTDRWTMPKDIKYGKILRNNTPKMNELRRLRAQINKLYAELEVALSAEGATHCIEKIETISSHGRDYYVLVDVRTTEIIASGNANDVFKYCHKRKIDKVYYQPYKAK